MANLLFLASQVLSAAIGSGLLGGGGGGGGQLSLGGGGGGFGGIGDFLGGDGVKRRRRRRRALTASDKADIAFISGTLGKPAGRDFAMVVAARS